MDDDLVSKFLLGDVKSPANLIETKSNDTDLVSQYLSNPNMPTKVASNREDDFNNEGKPYVPMSGFNLEENRTLNREQKQRELKPDTSPSTMAKAGRFVTELPIEWGKNIGESYTGAKDYAIEGVKDVGRGLPATGVGKIGLGLLGAVASPFSGSVKTFVENPITQLTGNPEIGAKAGLIASTALPVGTGGRVVVKNLPKNQAISNIVDAVGKENIPEVLQRLKENPRLSLADVSPAARQMSQKLITTEGSHQNKFEKFVNDRVSSSKGAVEEAYNTSMGVPVNIVEKLKGLKQDAKDVGTKDIEPAIKGSGSVDISGVIKSIDEKLKPGINSVISAGEPLPLGDIEKSLEGVKKLLTDGKSVRTNASDLHNFQSALRAKADDLMNSSVGQDRQLGYALMNTRNQIVAAIDAASPKIKIKDAKGKEIEVGSYKHGLSKYRDEMQVQDAFTKGQLVTRNRLGQLEDHPEYWKEWISKASPEEIEAAKEGARLAVDHQINAMRFGGRKGSDIPEVEFNRQKLELLFGKQEVNQLARKLRDEKDIATTNSNLVGNSQTAMRMKSDSRVDLPKKGENTGMNSLLALASEGANFAQGGPVGLGAAAFGTIKALGYGAHKLKIALAKGKNNNMTDLLTATGSDRDQLIKILEGHLEQPKQNLLQRTRNFTLPVIPP